MKYISLLIVFALTSCGGTIQENVVSENDGHVAKWTGERIPVKISIVNNKTGNAKYDDLCHFIHIKAAQLLADTGKYDVVSDELLESQSVFMDGIGDQPQKLITFDIDRVLEYNGGTVKIAIFSTQRKRAEVELSMTLRSTDSELLSRENAKGSSTIGSWGVIMEVDRDKMLKGEGFWELNNSMLGVATSRALKNVIF